MRNSSIACVSVIVPSHNYGEFLPVALASLQAQTYRDWECVVVDDGSTDDTSKVVAGFTSRDPRFRYTRLEHAGLSAARNVGLMASSAEYVQFLDADDKLEPKKLRAHVDYLDRHRDIGIVYGDAATFEIGPDHGNLSPVRLGAVIGSGDGVVELLVTHNRLVVNAAVIRRSVINRVGVFSQSLMALEDWDFWMRCAVAGVGFAHHAPAETRALVGMHPRSMSRDQERMLVATVDVRQRFEGLALPAPARRSNARYLARVSLKLGVVHLSQGRVGRSLLDVLWAAPRVIRAYGFRSHSFRSR